MIVQPEGDKPLQDVLHEVLVRFDCTAGTIHRLTQKHLELVAYEGIPDTVLSTIMAIPIGKGMAGLAAERRKPVQVCNLQTDASGVARPGARETNLEGAITIPLITPEGDLRGTLGIAKATPHEFSDSETAELMRVGARIAQTR